jgi:hypothetical protein
MKPSILLSAMYLSLVLPSISLAEDNPPPAADALLRHGLLDQQPGVPMVTRSSQLRYVAAA